MSRKILAIIMALAMMLSLAACGECSHEWSDANCTEASVCAKCGEVNGEALGHNWKEASCAAPETCSNCGETKGEPLPHSYGNWTRNEPDMTRTCSVCGDTESQPLDEKLLLNSALDGKWEFYMNQDFDTYGTTASLSFEFDSGEGTMYMPHLEGYTITEIREHHFELSTVQYGDDGLYSFNIVFNDGSSIPGFYAPEEEMLIVMIGVDGMYLLTQNNLEREALAGTWVCAQDGELFYIELQPDGSFSGEINGPVSGTWHPKPAFDNYDGWHTGFSILFAQDGVYKALSGNIWLCENAEDAEEALGNNNADSINLLDRESNGTRFSRLIDMSLDELKATQNENADKIVGTWVSSTLKKNGRDGTESEESGEFSVTFNADGSVTSNLPELKDASWSYRGVEPSSFGVRAVFDVSFNGSNDYISLKQGGDTIYVSYSGSSTYYSSYFKMA